MRALRAGSAAARRQYARAGALTMEGMAECGQYAANSLQQQEAFRLLVPHVSEALQTLDSKRAVLADYGAAEGLATRQLVEALPVGVSSRLDVVVQVHAAYSRAHFPARTFQPFD